MDGQIVTRPHVDAGERLVHFERIQDVEAIIERNKRLAAEQQSRRAVWRHTASIPNIFIEAWLAEEWRKGNLHLRWSSPEFKQVIRRKLADPEYAFLRVDHADKNGWVGWR